jgi:glycosyltransferase involved in cell wall biosynthesis
MLISIITINYNNLKGLKKTVKSVFNQTYPNIEYIVVDGESTDGSAKPIEKNSEYFTYLVSEPDNGLICFSKSLSFF